MNPKLQEQLEAWVDGELAPPEAREIAARVASDPAARALCEDLRVFRRELREHEPAARVPETREFYWSKIRRGIEAEARAAARPEPPVRRARWWTVWLPAGAAAAGFAAVILALLPAGPTPGRLASATNGLSDRAMVGHVVESPLPEMTALTFYSARDSITVVWVGHADIL